MNGSSEMDSRPCPCKPASSLPTTGPLLLNALLNQDMYLAGSFIMMLSSLTVIGTLISDILLALVDPRIRLEEAAE